MNSVAHTPLLQVSDLHAWYGKSHILQGADFHIDPGEVVSLLGRNGVGRSTTCKAVMGLVAARGSVRLHGSELIGRSTHAIARSGIGYVPEDRLIFAGLTTRQNLELGVQKTAGDSWSLEDAYELFPRLRERAVVKAELLSGGEQQMLAMCRTLMGNPRLVMIDEPTEGLAPQLVEQVGDFLLRIAARGVAILLVEQKLTIALRVSQRVYVMGHGRMVYEGTPDALAADDVVRQAWLEV